MSLVRRFGAVVAVFASLIVPAEALGFEPLGDFGTPGAGAGQLSNPQGLDIDGGNTLSIASNPLARVDQYDTDGNFIQAYGADVIPGGPANTFEVCTAATTCTGGSVGGAAGQLGAPWDVAVSPATGAAVVPETGNSRVSQFAAGPPSFTQAIGINVIPGGGPAAFEKCTTATTCQAGTAATTFGGFASPFGATMVPSGNFVISDAAGRLQEFDPAGNPVAEYGGFPGSGAGQLTSPYGLTSTAGGELIVPEPSNRVSVFGANGTFKRAFGWDVIPGAPAQYEVCTIETSCQSGSSNPNAGGLQGPFGAAVGPGGEIYVTEIGGNRVSQFDVNGNFVRAFGYDVIPGGGVGFEICTAATTCKAGVAGAGLGQFNAPWGVAVDCRGTVYVSNAGGNRISKFGEPGVRKPPCPSNAFTFGEPKLNKKKGTAKLPVTLPGPGSLSLAGNNLKPQSLTPTVAGELDLTIKAKGKAKKKLKKKGKAKVKPSVTFTPTNGDPNTQTDTVKLKKKRKKK